MYDAAKYHNGLLTWGEYCDGSNTKKFGKWDRSWPVIITIQNAKPTSIFDLATPRIYVQGNHLHEEFLITSNHKKKIVDYKSTFGFEFVANDNARIVLEENYFYPIKEVSWTNRSFFQANVQHNINLGYIAGKCSQRLNIHTLQVYKKKHYLDRD